MLTGLGTVRIIPGLTWKLHVERAIPSLTWNFHVKITEKKLI